MTFRSELLHGSRTRGGVAPGLPYELRELKMKIPEANSGTLRLFGAGILGCGMLIIAQNLVVQIRYSICPDMGVVFGSGAIALTGLVALTAASCMKELEGQLGRLEKKLESQCRLLVGA